MLDGVKWKKLYVAVCMLAVCLVGTVSDRNEASASYEALFAESFDGTTTGGYPGSFDALVPKSGYTATVEEIVGATNKSLELSRHTANTTDSFYVSASWAEQADKIAVTLKAKAGQTDMIGFVPILRSEDGGAIAQVSFYSDGRIRVFAGGTWTSTAGNLQAYAANVWYEIKLVADVAAQTFEVYIDGVPAGQSFAFQTYQETVSTLQFGLYRGAETGSLAIDDVKADILATGIELDEESLNLEVGFERQLQATIIPGNASDKRVVWTSEDDGVATVDQTGLVHAVSEGETVIHATSHDGSWTASCEVEVVGRSIQAIYYVSPNGADSSSGTESLPFKTIGKARDAVRAINASMTGDIIVYLRGGVYELQQTFELDETDSGSQGYNVIYRAYPDETPVLSGGREITGWTLHDAGKGIYRAPSQGIDTRQLYVDGVRAVRARSELGLNNAVLTASGFTTTDTSLAAWNEVEDLEFVFQEKWTQPRVGVDSITASGGLAHIVMKSPGWHAATHKGSTSISRGPVYYENAYELLDREGEWYLDKSAGYFYYKPRLFEELSTATVVAPVLEELARVEGGALNTPAHNIQFQGLAFAYATWLHPGTAQGLPDVQNSHLRYPGQDDRLIDAAVVVRQAHNIVFERNEFSKLGSAALQFIDGVQHSLIRGNQFFDISGGAINVGKPTVSNSQIYAPSDARLEMRRVDVTNNYIHDIGVEYASAAAISAGFPFDMEISHNHIFNIPYSGIHIGYGWYSFVSAGVKDVRVRNNYIHDLLGQGVYDGGAIYTVGHHAVAPDSHNIASGNYIENQMNRTAVLYADNGSDYWTFRDNVIDLRDTPVWPHYDTYWLRGTEEELIFDNNFITSGKVHDLYGTPLNVTNTHVYPDADWPTEALDIIANAGLEPEYDDLANGHLERIFVPKIIELELSQTYPLTPAATRNKGETDLLSGADIFYGSDNEAVATVSAQGLITALSPGKAEISTHVLQGEVIRVLKTDVCVGISGKTVICETFDRTTTGGYPGSFDALVPKSGYTATVKEIVSATDKSLEMSRHTANTTDSFYVSASWAEQADKIAVTLKAKAGQTDMIGFVPILRSEDGGAIAQVSFYSDGRIRVFAGGTWTSAAGNLQAYTANVWYEIKLVADVVAQTFDVYIDGVPAGQSFDFQTYQETMSTLQFGLYKGAATGSLAIDDVMVYAVLPGE